MRLDDKTFDQCLERWKPFMPKDLASWTQHRAALVIVLGLVGRREATANMPLGAMFASKTDRTKASAFLQSKDPEFSQKVAQPPPEGHFWVIAISDRKVGLRAIPWPAQEMM